MFPSGSSRKAEAPARDLHPLGPIESGPAHQESARPANPSQGRPRWRLSESRTSWHVRDCLPVQCRQMSTPAPALRALATLPSRLPRGNFPADPRGRASQPLRCGRRSLHNLLLSAVRENGRLRHSCGRVFQTRLLDIKKSDFWPTT